MNDRPAHLSVSTIALAALLAACSGPTARQDASAQPDAGGLIPRAVIFGNPERAGGRVSPDGRYVSFLAPRAGVLNIWVVERGKPLTDARAVTNEKVRPIRNHTWAANGEDILYTQDKGGDENFLLYAVNARTGAERLLTDYKAVRVEIYHTSLQRPDEIVVGINDRDKAWHDPYLLNVRTGALKKLFDNTEHYSGFILDDDLQVRLVTRPTPDGGEETLRWEAGRTTPFEKVGFEDSQTTGALGFSRDGRTLYWRESRGRNTSALVAIDMAGNQRRVVGEDARADVGGIISDPESSRVLAYSVDYLKPEWRVVDPSVKPDVDFLDAKLKGTWAVQSQTRDNRLWVVGHDPVTAPARALLYDRSTKSLTELYVARPKLAGVTLPEVCPVEIKSRDGLTLVSYLSLPPGSDRNGDCRPDKPLPLVLDVHGGPWGRDSYGYNGESVWFANRGYASLRVNFRASTGFGKEFTNKGDLEWGRKMHDDLLDGLDWAVKNGVAQPDRIAVFGGSYGGYATLWEMTHSPERYACGIAIVAPSNLETLFASIPPYWESFREQMYRRVGDLRTEDGRKLLKERSPLYYAERIRKPLLIGQGANDPRVKQAEADQILAAMEAKKIPVTYVLYPDEGHGFARAPNRTSFYAVSEAFLAECLGGRFEAVGNDFKGSSITVPKGAAYVPGLEAAMQGK
ncbi:MAG TPA: S9 family peptidase [Usitatibacter sp.]|nr:S9 family peptidase [Usitatibacter sp.]